MGHLAKCSECNFSFAGGHSHHASASYCFCAACLALFSCPTEVPMGPRVGERIEVKRHVRAGSRWRPWLELYPTGVFFTVELGTVTSATGRTIATTRYPIDTVPCPDCGAHALKMGFEDGEACPMCKKGTLAVEFIEY